MREIKLTRGYVAIVDDLDYPWVSQYKWHADVKRGGKYVYAASRSAPRRLMHREITKASDWQEIDHKNKNTLDCRKSNLRITDRRGNQQNRSDHSPYGPGIRERRDKYPKRPFEVRVFMGGRLWHVGNFPTPELARLAREEYLREHR